MKPITIDALDVSSCCHEIPERGKCPACGRRAYESTEKIQVEVESWGKHEATVLFDRTLYRFDYETWEILELVGKKSQTINHWDARNQDIIDVDPDWDDVTVDHIKQFIRDNWDRRVEVERYDGEGNVI